MERRELLKMITLATGGALIGGELLLSGCKINAKPEGIFSADDIAFLDEMAETIIPKTNTPGAKDAEVGKFMTIMVNDCYEAKDQKIFHNGLIKLEEVSKKKFSSSFMKITAEQRKELLIELDKEAKAYQSAKKETEPNHYFTMMKQLTLFGFFTSKPGATEALRYVAIPGKYEGSVPYKKGDKAWATS